MAAKVYETTISGTEGKSLKKSDLYDNSSTEILLETEYMSCCNSRVFCASTEKAHF